MELAQYVRLRSFCKSPSNKAFDSLTFSEKRKFQDVAAELGMETALSARVPKAGSDVLPDQLSALAVQQPAASLLAEGVKKVENRSRRLLHPDRWHFPLYFLILASKRPMKGRVSSEDGFQQVQDARTPALAKGKIVGAAELLGIYPPGSRLSPDQEHFRFPGAHMLKLGRSMVLPNPVPYKGQLGFFSVKTSSLGPTNVEAIEAWAGAAPDLFVRRRRR